MAPQQEDYIASRERTAWVAACSGSDVGKDCDGGNERLVEAGTAATTTTVAQLALAIAVAAVVVVVVTAAYVVVLLGSHSNSRNCSITEQ